MTKYYYLFESYILRTDVIPAFEPGSTELITNIHQKYLIYNNTHKSVEPTKVIYFINKYNLDPGSKAGMTSYTQSYFYNKNISVLQCYRTTKTKT